MRPSTIDLKSNKRTTDNSTSFVLSQHDLSVSLQTVETISLITLTSVSDYLPYKPKIFLYLDNS
jgi:hypothetical protein